MLTKRALPLSALLGEDMLLVRLVALQLARSGLAESLRGAAMRLHFRHKNPSFLFKSI